VPGVPRTLRKRAPTTATNDLAPTAAAV
jgi:hypothetical protein